MRALVRCGASLLGLAGGVASYATLSDPRTAIYKLSMPLFHALEPEVSHVLAIKFASAGLVPRDKKPDPDCLSVKIWGKEISNPIGLAAGFDKHGEAIDGMLGLGFGLVEVGTVTPRPQDGNPKPRMFRLKADKAVINRYGFNSHGGEAVQHRLQARLQSAGATPEQPRSLWNNRLLGLNLGKNKLSPADSDEDYVKGVTTFGPLADYLVINISSPNTPGLRALQRREPLERLLRDAKTARDALSSRPPLLVKIAPDMSDEELEDVAAVAMSVGVDGIIISNTTISRPSSLQSARKETGGLSGPPVQPLALAAVGKVYRLTQGKLPIIGCGGVSSADDVIRFARAGASLVQLYTALAYEGPGLPARIKDDLAQKLEANKTTWMALIGADSRTA